MDEITWAMREASEWIKTHGGQAVGLEKQMDGRWFLRVNIPGEPNWRPDRNMFTTRHADLGPYPPSRFWVGSGLPWSTFEG